MDSTTTKRFTRSLRYAEDTIVGAAKCFCYTTAPEYLDIHEDIKMMIRLMEEGSHVPAGKLLYKRSRQISAKAAYELSARAKSDEERRFYQFIGDMNSLGKEEKNNGNKGYAGNPSNLRPAQQHSAQNGNDGTLHCRY